MNFRFDALPVRGLTDWQKRCFQTFRLSGVTGRLRFAILDPAQHFRLKIRILWANRLCPFCVLEDES
jgi:hypothetical protein